MKSLTRLLKPYKHEFYRGDSFQVYVKDCTIALELSLKLRLLAKKLSQKESLDIDIRAAIGIGEIKSPVRTLKQASGEPFLLSGRALDQLSDTRDRLKIVSNSDQANDIFRLVGRFVDFIFDDLTSKQSEVIFELLKGNTQARAAKNLKKSQVTINRQARAAGWMEIQMLGEEYKSAITKYLQL